MKNSFARIEYLCITLPDFGCTHSGFLTVCIASGEKKFRLFLFFIYALSEVVKNPGLLCRKVTLKFVCYVTLGLAACSVDL